MFFTLILGDEPGVIIYIMSWMDECPECYPQVTKNTVARWATVLRSCGGWIRTSDLRVTPAPAGVGQV